MVGKCKIQKFKLKDFTALDEVYKKINRRMGEVMQKREVKNGLGKTVAKKAIKDGEIKVPTEGDIELVDLIAEAISGEDMMIIIKCGTSGCNIDDLDWDEGIELFKEIISSEENKDFFIKSYEAKIVAINPHSASSPDSGTSSSAS